MEDISLLGYHDMTQQRAIEIMRAFHAAVISVSSDLITAAAAWDGNPLVQSFDDLGPCARSQLRLSQGWLFGDRSIRGALDKFMQDIDSNGLTALEFLNWIYLAHRIPIVLAASLASGVRIPAPDQRWVAGWAKEASDSGQVMGRIYGRPA